MSNKCNPKTDPGEPMVYQIRLKSHLGSEWTDWFEGLTIALEDNGDTPLSGPIVDQAALHGLLKRMRQMSNRQVQCNETRQNPSKREAK